MYAKSNRNADSTIHGLGGKRITKHNHFDTTSSRPSDYGGHALEKSSSSPTLECHFETPPLLDHPIMEGMLLRSHHLLQPLNATSRAKR